MTDRRLLYLSPRLPFPPDDGGRVESWNLLRSLAWNGYEIDLVGFAAPAEEALIAAEVRALCAEVHLIGFDVRRQYLMRLGASLATGRSYLVCKYTDRRLRAVIVDVLARRAYTGVLLDHVHMGVYLPDLVSGGNRLPVVLREQNVESDLVVQEAAEAPAGLRREVLRREVQLFRRFENRVVGQVDQVFAITAADAGRLTVLSGREVLWEPAFVDPDELVPAPSSATQVGAVVCVSDFGWPPNIRGIEWFLDQVWADVRTHVSGAHLYLVGKDAPPQLRGMNDPSVTVTGRVPDVTPYLRLAHVVIAPVFEGSGVRIKALMALGIGKPVLTTAVGGAEIQCAGLHRAETGDEWVAVLDDWLGTPPRINQAGIDYVCRHHHWRRTWDPFGVTPGKSPAREVRA